MGEVLQMKFPPEVIMDDKLSTASYPVGRNFDENIKLFDLMYTHLIREFPGKNIKCICFWVRGSSGCCIATYLATKLSQSNFKVKSKILIIRKSGERSHSSQCETYLTVNQGVLNVIVDDFVASGETLTAIYKGITDQTMQKDPVVDLLLLTSYLDVDNVKAMHIRKIICQRYKEN